MSERRLRIGPSIMTADFLRLGEQIAEAEAAGVDFFHLDVMDGRYVPNISFGFAIVEAVRSATSLPLDVHLMIVEPEKYVERFVAAGADIVIVHVEACTHLHSVTQLISAAGGVAGVALNPASSLDQVSEILPLVGEVLVMSVNPGFGGQSFIPTTLNRLLRVRQMIDASNPGCLLEVDGGVKVSNIARVAKSGADSFVTGSAIYAEGVSVETAVKELRSALEGVA